MGLTMLWCIGVGGGGEDFPDALLPALSATPKGHFSCALSIFGTNTCLLYHGESPIMECYLWGHKHTHTKSVLPKVPDDDQQLTISQKGNGYTGTSKIGMALSYPAKKH